MSAGHYLQALFFMRNIDYRMRENCSRNNERLFVQNNGSANFSDKEDFLDADSGGNRG